jgi:hypothetical protein
MRIAETTSRAWVALSTVSLLALVGVTWPGGSSAVITAQPKATPRITKLHGCGAVAKPKAQPAADVQAPNPYRDVLLTARTDLEQCMTKFSDGLDIGIRVQIGDQGRMTDLHVRTRGAEELNDHLSPCFLAALEKLEFPKGSGTIVVSTFLSSQ